MWCRLVRRLQRTTDGAGSLPWRVTVDGRDKDTYLAAEARARVKIDEKLAAAGWVVQHYRDINLGSGPGVAMR